MATMRAAVTDTPQNLIAALSLTNGGNYLIQNRTTRAVYLTAAASAPNPDSAPAFQIAQFGYLGITANSGIPAWVWGDGDGYLIVSES